MPLLALIVSVDGRDIRVLREVLRELQVESMVCSNAAEAGGALVKTSVDAVLLDGDLDGIEDVIDRLTRSQAGTAPKIVAILSGREESQRAFEFGAHFVLYKPVSRDRSLVSLEYAFRSTGKERRDADRRSLYFPTTVSSPVADSAAVTLLNLSPTGTQLQAKKRLPPDSKLYFEFQIPGHTAAVRLSGTVVWQDIQGRAGIRFASVPSASRKVLDQWLDRVDREEPREVPEVAMEVDRFGPLDHPGDRDPAPTTVFRQNLVVPTRRERRSQSRYAFAAGVRVADQRSGIPSWCNIADISRGGCFIELVVPFPKGTQLTLEVRAGDLKFRTQGEVKSSQPGKGMGIQFKIEGEVQRDQVNQVVEFLAAGSSLRES